MPRGIATQTGDLCRERSRVASWKDEATLSIYDIVTEHRMIRHDERRARAICFMRSSRGRSFKYGLTGDDDSVGGSHARDDFLIGNGTHELRLHRKGRFFDKRQHSFHVSLTDKIEACVDPPGLPAAPPPPPDHRPPYRRSACRRTR